MIKTESIKYAGSKLKLLPYIREIIPNGIKTVLDGFSGTTRVSQLFSQLGYDTTANDLSAYSKVLGLCYLKSKNSDKYYQEILDYLNNLKGYSGWFTENYGGKKSDNKKPFRIKNMKKLDAIREEIDNLKLKSITKSVVLTSLLLALDKVDSTLGHFSSYLYNWSARSSQNLYLVLPKRFNIKTNNTVIQDSVFNTIKNNYFDLAYFDPPYGSNNEKMPPSRVRYNSYYHFWTTVVLNDRPELFGKVNRRVDSKDTVSYNPFEDFRKNDKNKFIAMETIRKLIKKTNAKYVLLSYSSGGRANKEELMSIIDKYGKLKRFISIDYKKNVMSNMKWTKDWINDNNKKNQEFLFLIKK